MRGADRRVPGASTLAVRVGRQQDLTDVHCEPIALTSAYVFASAAEAAARFSGASPGNVYSRFTNPTVRAFEQRLAAMEGAEDGVAFASGMAAIAAIGHAWLQAGRNVVCSRDVFGTTLGAFRRYFGKFGVGVRLVDLTSLPQWQAAIDERTALVFVESPSNPVQRVGDIARIARLAHAHGALLVVDNTMLTPIHQLPLGLGADLVLHSAGKYLDGQGRCVAGIVVGRESLMDELRGVLRTMGASLSPMNAWLLLKSLETLRLRVDAIHRAAGQLAQWLQAHPRVGQVHYTGLPTHPQHELALRQQAGHGGVVSFDVGRCQADAWRMMDALKVVAIATNIGETRTMVTHPASTTHGKLSVQDRLEAGIGAQLVRISVGLEDPADLMADLDAALASAPVAGLPVPQGTPA
ncbi:O-succinylhomoserine sulfhydrylase [Aquincola sp. MAHUQ-54]|uniref:O-succinylhomoserine sulfhydrylase n=1 Tax=Aquincola agrisoli TaxID=3119538 RepID=A0AAW9Q5U0_9BURK